MRIFRAVMAVMALLAAAGGVAAQTGEPAPFPEFTFRRVTPPGEGFAGRRITIQIAPPDPAAAAAGREDRAETPPPPADPNGAGWFWDVVPASLEAPGRFDQALRHLSAADEAAALGVPRLDLLRRLAEAHGRDILSATVGTPVSPALVLAVMSVESAGAGDAVSSAGAQGLMQLIPATAERFGVEDAFDASQNIVGGVAYLSWLMEEFDRDPVLVLAAYNAGEGAVRDNAGVPPYAETRRYVPKVLATWQVARLLCLTPPDLISDGCVFDTLGTRS